MTLSATNPRDRINEYELPIVPCMLHQAETEDVFFVKNYLDDLSARQDKDRSIRWALEVIADLQQMWEEVTDKQHAIERIINTEKNDHEKGKDIRRRMERKKEAKLSDTPR